MSILKLGIIGVGNFEVKRERGGIGSTTFPLKLFPPLSLVSINGFANLSSLFIFAYCIVYLLSRYSYACVCVKFILFKWTKPGLFSVYFNPFLNTMTNTYSTKN